MTREQMSATNGSQEPGSTETGDPSPFQGLAFWKRGYWSLFLTQFQGAFSDNAFKFLVTFLVMGELTTSERDRLAPVVGAVFALPFILFSMSAGFLSDRYSKRSVAIGTKALEVGIMLLAVLGLALNHFGLLIAVVFLLSTQSAFFGPAKYGLLPEMLPSRRLSWGNGLLSLGTFVAIITGTIAAGQLSEWFQDRQVWSGIVLLVLALIGLTSSFGISRVPAADPSRSFRWNIIPEFRKHWQLIRRDRVLHLAVLGDAYFWLLAPLLQLTLLFYAKDVLLLDDVMTSYLTATLAIGIGVGSGTAGYVSGQKIEYGLVPLGALGITILTALLSLPGLTFVSASIILGLLGFFSGFYVVPLTALIQHRPDPKHKGSVIATVAVLSFTGVFLASCFYYILTQWFSLSLPQVFLFCAVMTLVGTVLIIRKLPDALLRLVLWMATHSLYRITVEGRDRIPSRGGALLVSNHLSLVDAAFILASTDRHVRFLMHKDKYERRWIQPFARILGVIPISSRQNPREMIDSLKAARRAIEDGALVCIFAEGQISRTGQMLPFRSGLERIMKGLEAPIIPVHLDGVWGSIFSFDQGRFLWKWPRRIPYPVTVNYGSWLPATASAAEVRQKVQELGTGAWAHRRRYMLPLAQAFIRCARLNARRRAMSDARYPDLNFGATLTRSVFLAHRLRDHFKDQPMVGLMVPPSVGGTLANLACLLMGRVPVNLNYTLSGEALRSCIDQCDIRTIVASRELVKHLNITLPGKVVWLEDLAGNPGFLEKCRAALQAWLLPRRWLERALSGNPVRNLDNLATVIFSSGSTGEPKGIKLTHYNIVSNIEQLAQTFAIHSRDGIMGVLPFFHSFGFTGTLCLPLTQDVRVVYHANPLDGRTIGSLVEKKAATFLLATPTFLQLYLRSCQPEQFGSLRFVMVGAEKLPDRLADAFESRFGIRPLEAYGCTECSPAVTVNTQDFRGAGLRQVGGKRGRIGHPLPGISVRIVDPDTRQALPQGEAGLLLVQGPNVMEGYLGQPDKSAEVLHDAWYVTGDIATMDEDGFLSITDRLSRFSKIGGEMVPHIKVEEHLHELAEETEQAFAVVGVPDERKGERLVVLHRLSRETLDVLLSKLQQSDLPNLWKPRSDQFFEVDQFPMLGTGKLNLRQLRALALERGAPS